jgi:hypothetical protein
MNLGGADGRFVVKAQIPGQARVGATGVRIYANDASLDWYDVTLGIRVLDAQASDNVSTGTPLAPMFISGAAALLLCLGLGAGLSIWRRRRNHASAISSSSGDVTQSGGDDDD